MRAFVRGAHYIPEETAAAMLFASGVCVIT
jgi:hypothetical protein